MCVLWVLKTMSHPLDYLTPIEQQQLDCCIVLRLPAASVCSGGDEGPLPSKRHRAQPVQQEAGSGNAVTQCSTHLELQDAEEPATEGETEATASPGRTVRLPANSLLLAAFSEKFK
jgi:hypothetical protein